MASPFVIMTGASGVGKTTIARTIRKLHPEIPVFLDEELKRPTDEFMESIGPTEGPGGPFQRGFALYSIPQLAKARQDGRPMLLDCQCRITFLQEAITTARITDARIVLVECDDQTRDARLNGRGSPELAHEQMRNWSKYLHQEAVGAVLDILDTGANSLDGNVARVLAYL
jgi:energy-coupling factor transporter ATP-binding protein EcfA2